MNIRVDLNTPIKDGTEVVFRSPVDCSQVTGLIVYYRGDDGNTASQEFMLSDANGNNVGDIDHLFAENVAVKVILDVSTSMAFVQNADTNAYLEGRFAEFPGRVTEDGGAIFGDYASLRATENAAAFGGIGYRAGTNGEPTQESWLTNEDLMRYTEATQPGAIAGGQGAYAFARSSKSLGARTQTGYALKKYLKETTFIAVDEDGNEYEVTAVDPSVVPYVLKDGSYAETYEQIIDELGYLPGQGALSTGADTAAVEHQSFAGGWDTRVFAKHAFGYGSHVRIYGLAGAGFGEGSELIGPWQLIGGRYNEKNASLLFAIGNGTSDDDRFNAFQIRRTNKDKKDAWATMNGTFEVKNAAGETAFIVDKNGDAFVNGDTLSSDKTIMDKLCPAFDESGAVVTCEPVEGYPLSVVTDIRSTQGTSKATLWQSGKNMFNGNTGYTGAYGATAKWNGILSVTGYMVRCNSFPISPSTTYTLSYQSERTGQNGGGVSIKTLDAYGTATELAANVNAINGKFTFTTPANAVAMQIQFYGSAVVADKTSGAVFEQIQLELGNVKTEYEVYNGNIYTVDFGKIVDEGSYDWTNGILHDEAVGETTQLPAQKINALPGINILYSDTGDTTVVGRVNPVAVIEKLTNAIIALGGKV